MNLFPERIPVFFQKFPELSSVIEKLNAAQIPFAIGGSGCLFLYGNERLPDDVDIYLPDDRHDEADRLFNIESYTYKSETEEVRNSNPGGGHAIQLTSQLVLQIAGKEYRLSLSRSVLNHLSSLEYQGQKVTLYPVEDVLLIKALLQRGPEVGKHDLEDIQRFLKIQPSIDRAYLTNRIEEIKAEERVGSIFI